MCLPLHPSQLEPLTLWLPFRMILLAFQPLRLASWPKSPTSQTLCLTPQILAGLSDPLTSPIFSYRSLRLFVQLSDILASH